MITRRGERDREGGTGRKKGWRKSQREGGRGGKKTTANVLKEIAGMSFLKWN